MDVKYLGLHLKPQRVPYIPSEFGELMADKPLTLTVCMAHCIVTVSCVWFFLPQFQLHICLN